MKLVRILLAFSLSIAMVMSIIACTRPGTNDDVSAMQPASESGAELNAEKNPVNHDGFVLNSFESGMEIPEALRGMDTMQAHGLETVANYIVKSDLADSKVTFDGTDYTYNRSTCSLRRTTKDEYGTFYSSYDRYERADGAWISYISGTELLARYSNHHFDGVSPVDGSLTDEEAKKIADEFLQSVLPEEVWSSIPWKTTDERSDLGVIYVGYNRDIHGYITDEDILVGVNSEYGVVEGYNGVCVGKYTALEPLLTKELLDETAAKLEAKVLSLGLEGLNMREPSLTTNTDGDVYMALAFDYYNEVEGTSDLKQILCKVELTNP